MSAETPADLAVRLRTAVGSVLDLVATVAGALSERAPAGAAPAGPELLSRLADLDTLRRHLDVGIRKISARARYAERDAAYGADSWTARRDRRRAELDTDRESGTTSWLRDWVRAVGAGEWDEADRLVSFPFELADHAAWWPDRCAAALDAIREAERDPERSAERLTEVVDLARRLRERAGGRGQPAAGPGPDRIELPGADVADLLLVLAQALARSRTADAVEVLECARVVGAKSDRGRLASGLLAAESFVDRHAEPANRTSRPWSDLLRAAATTDLRCLVEYVRRAAGDAADDQALAATSSLVSELPDVAGADSRLLTLLEPAPDEVVVEVAARLASDGQHGAADRLLKRRPPGTGRAVDVRAADIHVDLERARKAPPVELGQALADAARQAMWGSDMFRAVDRFRESLAVRPGHAETMRQLADVVVHQAWAQPRAGAEPLLSEALELCREASRLEPVTPSTSWALGVEQAAHAALGGFPTPERARHLWMAVRHSARAAGLDPSVSWRWLVLSHALTSVGVFRAAHLAADRAYALDPDNAEIGRMRAVTALNLADPAAALAAIDGQVGENDEERAWLAVLRGLAHRLTGEYDRARDDLREGVRLDGAVRYRQWLAELETVSGQSTAAGEWKALWRDVDVATVDGMTAGAWASAHQRLPVSAGDLAGRLEPLETFVMGDRSSLLVRGVSQLQGDDPAGWATLRAAFGWMTVPGNAMASAALVAALLPAEMSVAVHDLATDRCAALAALFGAQDLPEEAEAELRWVDERAEKWDDTDLARAATQEVRQALAAPASTGVPEPAIDPGVTPPSSEAAEVVQVALPASWFADLAGRKTDHPLFRRALPDARAALRRQGLVEASRVGVNVRVEESCEPDQMWVEPTDQPRRTFTVAAGRSYCPGRWLAALPGPLRATARPGADPGIFEVSAPSTLMERLATWTAAETAAWHIFDLLGQLQPERVAPY